MIKKKKSAKQNRNSGFTLFELLVSISIIAVMTAVAVVSFGGLNKKARDQRRISDVEKIRVALESYKQINNYYPPESTVQSLLISGGFLDKWPTDPKQGTALISYKPAVAPATTYFLCAPVELVGSTTPPSEASGCTGLPSTGYPGYYKVTQP